METSLEMDIVWEHMNILKGNNTIGIVLLLHRYIDLETLLTVILM